MLSPFFRVVKVDPIGARGIDYERISWEDAVEDARERVDALGPEPPGEE